PAPRPAAPVDDDPIGQGGFITPPTVTMQICVSADFASSWENASAGSEMEAFRGLIGDYVLADGKSGQQYRIKSNAYVTFEGARRAAPASTPLPKFLVDALPAGQS